MRYYSGVEPLMTEHRRRDFTCTSEALNAWFRQHALTAHATGTSKAYVVRRLADDLVVGFYSLSGGAVRREDATERVLKGTGRYPDLPVIVLNRLAVDISEERKGLGRALLKDAFSRVISVADTVGIRALLIHAEDERAVDFYMKIANFEQSPTDDLHLLLLMKDLRRAMDR